MGRGLRGDHGVRTDGDTAGPDAPGRGHGPDDDEDDELPRLMALLGRLLDRHGPGGVVVVSREEYERRELTAYACGWQDAADEYLPRITAARWEGRLGPRRPLRLLDGPGDVLPFPTARQPPPGEGDPPAGSAAGAGHDASGHNAPGHDTYGADGAVTGHLAGPSDGPAPGPAAGAPRPVLPPKNRRSRAPTIPRLRPTPPRRPVPPGDGPAGGDG